MRRPSTSVVISSLALIVALGGTGVAEAAVSAAKNSIGTKQLKKNAVRSSDIKNGAVTSADIKNGGVGTADLAANAVTGAQVKDGSIGKADLAAGVLPARYYRAAATVDSDGDAGDPEFMGPHPGFTAVERAAEGTYCLTLESGIPATHNNAVASVEWFTSSGTQLLAHTVTEQDACAANQLQVFTFLSTTGAETDDASFSVLVP